MLILGNGQPKGTGVTPRGPMPEGVRTYRHPEPSDGTAGLHGPRAARRHGVQDNDRRRGTSESKQLQRSGDGFQV